PSNSRSCAFACWIFTCLHAPESGGPANRDPVERLAQDARCGRQAAGLEPLLDAVLSVEEVGVYKPHPKVYQLAVDRLGVPAGAIPFQSLHARAAFRPPAFGK